MATTSNGKTDCDPPPIPQFRRGAETPETTVDERAKIQADLERLRRTAAEKNNESCPSCLYVGVATSLGLASYFAHAAFEKVDERTLTEVALRNQRYNKPVFLAISVGWLGIGAYRWHLG